MPGTHERDPPPAGSGSASSTIPPHHLFPQVAPRPGVFAHRRANLYPASYLDWRGAVKGLSRRSDAAVAFPLVAEPVSLVARSQVCLIQHDLPGEGHPQGVEVWLFGEGQPASHVGVDLNRLGEQLRPPALGLHPP